MSDAQTPRGEFAAHLGCKGDDYCHLTPSECMEMVWKLTQLTYWARGIDLRTVPFRKDVVRVIRGPGQFEAK